MELVHDQAFGVESALATRQSRLRYVHKSYVTKAFCHPEVSCSGTDAGRRRSTTLAREVLHSWNFGLLNRLELLPLRLVVLIEPRFLIITTRSSMPDFLQ